MRFAILYIGIFFFSHLSLCGQTRIIKGRVISEHFETLPQVWIQNKDTVLIGKTDIEGNFTIEIPSIQSPLLISWIGMESQTIDVPIYCDNVEIILIYSGSYDFMSPRKVDRLRKKRFNKLAGLHLEAYEKGIFNLTQPCYQQNFIPIRERLKEIKRTRQKKKS